MDTVLAPTICPQCAHNYAAFESEANTYPMPGDPSCCPNCCARLVYTDELTLRLMTKLEYRKLSKKTKELWGRIADYKAEYTFFYGDTE